MPDAFDAALRVLFSDPNGSAPAIYMTAQGAQPRALRVIVEQPSDSVQGNPLGGRVITESLAVELLVADVPAKPAEGSRLQLRGQAYRLSNVTRDKRGRVWRAVLNGVGAGA